MSIFEEFLLENREYLEKWKSNKSENWFFIRFRTIYIFQEKKKGSICFYHIRANFLGILSRKKNEDEKSENWQLLHFFRRF